MYSARFQFTSDRAHEFLDEGRLVDQQEFDNTDDIVAFADQFRDALEDVNVYCKATGEVVNLSDFSSSFQ